MTIIKTSDDTGGTYMTEDPRGIFGRRCHKDRRYWDAWAAARDPLRRDCIPGVMDDFGTLVPVPRPSPENQQ